MEKNIKQLVASYIVAIRRERRKLQSKEWMEKWLQTFLTNHLWIAFIFRLDKALNESFPHLFSWKLFVILILPFAALIISLDGYRLPIAVFCSVRLVTIFLLFSFLECASRTYRLRTRQITSHQRQVEESHSVSLRRKTQRANNDD